jgi:hypothetical protein
VVLRTQDQELNVIVYGEGKEADWEEVDMDAPEPRRGSDT